jgi:hypothetical protein
MVMSQGNGMTYDHVNSGWRFPNMAAANQCARCLTRFNFNWLQRHKVEPTSGVAKWRCLENDPNGVKYNAFAKGKSYQSFGTSL